MNIPKIELATKEEIEAYQEKALQELIQYVYEKSPFYKAHFQKHHIAPESIKRLSDLSLIPAIGKRELQKYNKQFYCVGPSAIIDYSNTSGTEGEAVTIPLTEKDLERLTYNEAISLACTGGDENEIYQLTTTVDRRFMAGLAYVMGARRLGAGMIRVGAGIPELQWKTILEVNPTALIVVPSFLLKLIDYAEANAIDLSKTSVQKAICIGEPIRHEDFSLNPLGQRIKEKWNINLYSTYASSEMATAFTECEAKKGGHAHPELIITEILDDEGQPVAPGEVGELTVTTLGVEAMPLIRFRTGDICRKHEERCSCGRNTYRLGPIIGRKHQMIKYKGTTVYPPALCNVMDNAPEIKRYVIEVCSNEYDSDEVIVRYEATERLNIKKLIDHFKTKVRVTPRLVATAPEELDKLMFPQMSRKPVKFIDNRMRSF